MIQKEYFSYKSDERLKRMRHLNYEQDILRVKTKIMHAEDNMDFSRPMVFQIMKLLND